MVRTALFGAVLLIVLAIYPASEALAQQLICEPYWTAEYKCEEHCGPCAGGASGAPAVGGGLTTQQQMGAQLGSLGASMILQGLQQVNQEAAARQAAAAQAAQAAAQRAAEEQQRRAAEIQRRAEEIKSQLIGINAAADSDASLPLIPVRDDASDLKLMTLDQSPPTSPPTAGTQTTASLAPPSRHATGCTPSQDPSVVDLCGHGDVVDPSIVKNGGGAPASTSTGGTAVDPTAAKQGSRPCPFVNGEPQCGQSFRMERNQPCPLDANGVPQCGAPAGEDVPGGNASALPGAVSAPPVPSQSAYDPNLSGQARQDAAARSASQASADEYDGVAHDAAQLQHQTKNVLGNAAQGAAHGIEGGPGGVTIGAALGAAHGGIENHFENDNGN